MSSGSTSKPEIPQKPRMLLPPPVPKRTNPQRAQPAVVGLESDYPMNATWLFHAPAGSGGDDPEILGGLKQQQQQEWLIRERVNANAPATVELPPKMNMKNVPVLPVKVQSQSSSAVQPPGKLPQGGSPTAQQIIRDVNFANEIKSRCIQRLLEKLPPQVHYVSSLQDLKFNFPEWKGAPQNATRFSCAPCIGFVCFSDSTVFVVVPGKQFDNP